MSDDFQAAIGSGSGFLSGIWDGLEVSGGKRELNLMVQGGKGMGEEEESMKIEEETGWPKAKGKQRLLN